MKLFFTLFSLIMVGNISFSQKTTTLPNYEDTSFTWKGGDDKYYEVSYIYAIEDKIDKETLDDVIMQIMVKSQFVLKNRLTFIPKKLTIMEVENEYVGVSEFSGKNAYGVEMLTKAYFKFDLEKNVDLSFTN